MLEYEVRLEDNGAVVISRAQREVHKCAGSLPYDAGTHQMVVAYRAPCCGTWWRVKVTNSEYSDYARWVKISRFRMWRLKRKGVISSEP